MSGQLSIDGAVAEIKAEGLLEAAAVQRAIAAASATRDGKWEHEGIADWLEDRAMSLLEEDSG